jgi:two-component system, OmpR family, sensor histidine kinase BaeS
MTERRGGPRRPPWWPENEPFPPAGGWEAWGGMRRRFVRRMVVGALGLFLLLTAIGVVLGAVFGGGGWHAGADRRPGFLPFGLVFVGAMAVLFAFVARRIRRTAGSVGEVMEAVGRVADGDLGARVAARGVRDDRRLARAFNRMAERLETDEIRRHDLLADLAHELRTPLAVIRGNVEAMLDGLYPSDADHLRTVLGEIDVLTRLLDDLQTLSTAEAGALVLHTEPTDIKHLAEDAVAAFRVHADERRIVLRTSVEDPVPRLDVDAVRIGEVLANLIQNSLRHTPAGGIVDVGARRTSLDGVDAVEIDVADDGAGIDPELLPHVFDRFVRSSGSGGSGLGLAIAKSLVEAHGGTIVAHRRAAGGTVVQMVVPATVPR